MSANFTTATTSDLVLASLRRLCSYVSFYEIYFEKLILKKYEMWKCVEITLKASDQGDHVEL